MRHDARRTRLFTSPTRERQRKVNALRRRWQRQLAEQKPPRRLVVTYVTTEYDCLPGRNPDGVRALTDNAELVPDVPSVTAHDELATVVVFAASKTPTSPADVTVGLVLAAHLATSFDRNVSMVVLPRYIGSDLRLDQQLRDQRDVVSRGIVVGREGSIPEETRVVLRQILRSQDQLGRGERLRATFSDLGGLLTALLALLAYPRRRRTSPPRSSSETMYPYGRDCSCHHLASHSLRRTTERNADGRQVGRGPTGTTPPPTRRSRIRPPLRAQIHSRSMSRTIR